jgi:hypothetical protein
MAYKIAIGTTLPYFLPQSCNPYFIMTVKEENELRKSENEEFRKTLQP